MIRPLLAKTDDLKGKPNLFKYENGKNQDRKKGNSSEKNNHLEQSRAEGREGSNVIK
jgi:hypothetical protein